MKLHKVDNRPNEYGGTNYRTLCRRINQRSTDGMNVAMSDDAVTCKFCLRLMGAKSVADEVTP